ncbi:MAG: 50S ribosomal protein L13 [Anaerolinea sp.]|nr:50S ribosomal protein L13 [Anaerolinea sp.]MCC6972693.1 50S ribosomal protein L13 [Anaerolineae bacterium]CAG0970569.1 50S ribosomal protein L13 [Planctomycetaceae bacterium]
MHFKTYTPTAESVDAERKWYVVDATDMILGRLAARIAHILRGKHKATFAPHMDTGDYVIVLNADKVKVTGDRLDTKFYYRHSQFPGGFRQESLRTMLEKHPDRVIEIAVKGMLPHNRLGRKMVKKLKVYAGNTHPHGAHRPEKIEFAEAKKR